MRETFECCPIAYATFKVAAVLFTAFNFGSYLAATALHPLYTEWLNYSRTFTDLAAGFFSTATNAAAVHLQRTHATYLIPMTRNILAINFAFLIFAPIFFTIGILADIWRTPWEVHSGMLVLSTKLSVKFSELIVRCTVFSLLVAIPTVMGISTVPYAVSLVATAILYWVVFGGLILTIILDIYFVVCWMILRSSVNSKQKRN